MQKYPANTAVLSLDGEDFRTLFRAGSSWLELHHRSVNALNVFPVPDGDTGTNMLLTMQSALDEIETVETPGAAAVVKAAAHGALMGARGNSGVILSQILRGIAQGLTGEDLVDAAELVVAFAEGSHTAYRGVVRPVEGTILTVIREVSEALQQAGNVRDLRTLFDVITQVAADSVERTPTLLAVLAEAGVVDAGGQGLHLLLEGMHRALQGMEVGAEPTAVLEPVEHAEVLVGEYGYDVQCIVLGESLSVDDIRDAVLQMGDSVLVVGDEKTVKVHVHTDKPGTPLNYCAGLGQIDRIIVENMQTQYEQFVGEGGPGDDIPTDEVVETAASLLLTQPLLGPIGTVAVAAGEGLEQVFRSLGVHAVVLGGQTMNPSTEDLLTAVNALEVDDVIILPNNKNIILAARQAQELADKNVRVVPSKSMPQGIGALLVLNQQADLDTNASTMEAALEDVQTGEVTMAVRDVQIDDLKVGEGDLIGLRNGDLVVKGTTPEEVVSLLLSEMEAEECEIITLYWGQPTDFEAARELEARLREQYPEQEIELVNGGQPHYHYTLSVE
jgi:DAK2 domain fusion protein YloV